MDWTTFFSTNSSALIGLIGVVVGVILGAIPTFILQAKHRQWTLDDQRREWKRQRLSERINPIIDWVESVLELLSLFDAVTNEEIAKTELWEPLETQLHQQFKEHELKYASIGYQVTVIGDDQFKDYCNEFEDLRNHFLAVLVKKQLSGWFPNP
jgi:hypothetical protein